jgi:hypothetical protein
VTVRIFAVAVETYQSSKVPQVSYAENDATMFVQAWEAVDRTTESRKLLSARATKTTILSTFKAFLADVEPDDMVVFFYAGHGHRVGDANYITGHDVQPGDIAATSIALEKILGMLRKCGSEKILLFLDSCHSGMPTSDGMRSITSEFTADELRDFCKDARFHVGFASCGVDEYSWPSTALKHGIWTYHVIQAISGKAPKALDKGRLVTSASLRDYLAAEVPRELRRFRTGSETQTPREFGNASKTFIIADLENLFVKARALSQELGAGLLRPSFRGVVGGSIARLSGFRKGSHRVPDRRSRSADGFVQSLGEAEVSETANTIHDALKEGFGYKRKDLVLDADAGSATITTPDFNVAITIAQDPDDHKGYVQTVSVSSFKDPHIVFDQRFHDVFSGHCDTLVVEFERSVSVEEKIDQIEDDDSLSGYLSYEADLSSLTLELPNPRLKIRMTESAIEVTVPRTRDIGLLLKNYKDATEMLTSAGVRLLTRG